MDRRGSYTGKETSAIYGEANTRRDTRHVGNAWTYATTNRYGRVKNMADDTKTFATPNDLEQRWRTLTPTELTTATVLLEDATDLIKSLCPHWSTLSVHTLKRVACAIVKRAMTNGTTMQGVNVPDGITQMSTSTGSFSDSYTFANPSGDLYLTAMERKALGMNRQTAFHIHMDG